jgi:hypothetical protein
MSVNTNEGSQHSAATRTREPAAAPAEPVRRRKDAVHPSLRALPDYPVR